MDTDDFMDELGLGDNSGGDDGSIASEEVGGGTVALEENAGSRNKRSASVTGDAPHRPSVCMDATKDAAEPTRLDITGSSSMTSNRGEEEEEGQREQVARSSRKKRKGATAKSADAGNKPKKQKRSRRSKNVSSSTSETSENQKGTGPTTTGSVGGNSEEGPSSSSSSSASKSVAELREKDEAEKISEMVRRPRLSATDEAYRNVARTNIPAPTRERMLTSESTSFVTADPTRGEEKQTLASTATSPGIPLSDADLLSKGKELPKKSRRGKRVRKGTTTKGKGSSDTITITTTTTPPPPIAETSETSETGIAGRKRKRTRRAPPEPVVHRVSEIPSEGIAEKSGMREAREIEKHPGKVKTAGMGVAIPHPGDRESQLRASLDASALKRRDNDPEDMAIISGEGTEEDPLATRNAEHVTRGTEGWETDSLEQIASDLDSRRMGVSEDSDGSALIQPISQLKTAFANQNRITLEHLRVGISRFFSGIIDKRLLEVQAASEAIREKSIPRSQRQQQEEITGGNGSSKTFTRPGGSLRVPNTASPANSGKYGGKDATSAAVKRGQKTLILDDSEEAIADLFTQSVPAAPELSPFAENAKDEILFLPRLGLGNAVDMPLDEAELAVLRGGSTIREAMVYFMSFDDSVAAMTSAYKTACEMASMVSTTDAMHPKNARVGGNGEIVRRCMLRKLKEREVSLDREWEASGARDTKIWSQRFATRVLRAILSGELREQRHNIVRTLVAKEEGLLELYREPAQRCFLDGEIERKKSPHTNGSSSSSNGGGDDGRDKGKEEEEESKGSHDTDVIAKIREVLSGLGKNASGSEIPSTVLPDLGTPASKAYCADFLRAPDPDNALERPCARGERSCVAWLAASQPSWPSTGALNRGARAFVMREFHAPDAWQRILQSGSLPTHRGNCLMCSRYTSTYMYMQLRLLDTYSVLGIKDATRNQVWRGMLLGQSHTNAIDDEGGYTQSDMLPVCQPTDGPWTGIISPIVAYRANSYILGESTVPINMHGPKKSSLASQGNAAADDDGDDGSEDPSSTMKILPCFFERTATDFH